MPEMLVRCLPGAYLGCCQRCSGESGTKFLCASGRRLTRTACEECGRVSRQDERGWTAHLTVDEDEPAEVVLYCPKCDERESGS